MHWRKWGLPTRTRAVLVPLIRGLSGDVSSQGAIGVTADPRGKYKTKTKSVQRTSARRTLPPGRSVRRPRSERGGARSASSGR